MKTHGRRQGAFCLRRAKCLATKLGRGRGVGPHFLSDFKCFPQKTLLMVKVRLYCCCCFFFFWGGNNRYTGSPQKRNSRCSRFTTTLLWSTVIFFTLLDRASFPHYNNTKIIKFGWELFILWVISYGLSFSGFAWFPEFRGTINDKSMENPENDSP